jgi:hypothetical protein
VIPAASPATATTDPAIASRTRRFRRASAALARSIVRRLLSLDTSHLPIYYVRT